MFSCLVTKRFVRRLSFCQCLADFAGDPGPLSVMLGWFLPILGGPMHVFELDGLRPLGRQNAPQGIQLPQSGLDAFVGLCRIDGRWDAASMAVRSCAPVQSNRFQNVERSCGRSKTSCHQFGSDKANYQPQMATHSGRMARLLIANRWRLAGQLGSSYLLHLGQCSRVASLIHFNTVFQSTFHWRLVSVVGGSTLFLKWGLSMGQHGSTRKSVREGARFQRRRPARGQSAILLYFNYCISMLQLNLYFLTVFDTAFQYSISRLHFNAVCTVYVCMYRMYYYTYCSAFQESSPSVRLVRRREDLNHCTSTNQVRGCGELLGFCGCLGPPTPQHASTVSLLPCTRSHPCDAQNHCSVP